MENVPQSKTPVHIKCEILSDAWMEHRRDERFEEFIWYNDIGLPLAHMLSIDMVSRTDRADKEVNLAFESLLKLLEIEDSGFEDLDEMILASVSKNEE